MLRLKKKILCQNISSLHNKINASRRNVEVLLFGSGSGLLETG